MTPDPTSAVEQEAERLLEKIAAMQPALKGGTLRLQNEDTLRIVRALLEALTAREQERNEAMELLRDLSPVVVSLNEAEHMMDGFGPRTPQPSDALRDRVNAALERKR